MSKICTHCGATAKDDARFCTRCGAAFDEKGAEGKFSAEWQGKEYRFDFSPPRSGFPQPIVNDARLQTEERMAERQKAKARDRRKRLFVLAFVGLLLDFVCGIGVFLCLPVAILASVETKRLYGAEKRTSAQLIWAMTVGYTGALLGLLFFLLML